MSTSPRVIPELDDHNRAFWTGGESGRLVMLRCMACGHWIHPGGPVCPSCLDGDVRPEPLSGRARVATFTVNHQAWAAGLAVPFVLAIVDLPEQEGLRLTTKIVGCPPEDVEIGLDVMVEFEAVENIWVPVFSPAVVAA